jgi:hypothetical protein
MWSRSLAIDMTRRHLPRLPRRRRRCPPRPPQAATNSQPPKWEIGRRLLRQRGAGEAMSPPEDRDALHMRLAFFPLTDLGNAERFRERQRGRLLFNTALATTSPGRQRGWLAWDSRRWSSESGAERVMIAEHEPCAPSRKRPSASPRAAIATPTVPRMAPVTLSSRRRRTAAPPYIPTRSPAGADRPSQHKSSARCRNAVRHISRRHRPSRCRPYEDQRQQRHLGNPQAG